jgi:hypothetical protein
MLALGIFDSTILIKFLYLKGVVGGERPLKFELDITFFPLKFESISSVNILSALIVF